MVMIECLTNITDWRPISVMKIGSSDFSQYSKLEKSIKGVLILQCVVVCFLFVCLVIYSVLLHDNLTFIETQLKALLYGAALAIISTMLTARSMRRSDKAARKTRGKTTASLAPVFSGLLNKLVIVGGGLGFGLVIGLDPIFVISTYLIVQISASARLVLSDN